MVKALVQSISYIQQMSDSGGLFRSPTSINAGTSPVLTVDMRCDRQGTLFTHGQGQGVIIIGLSCPHPSLNGTAEPTLILQAREAPLFSAASTGDGHESRFSDPSSPSSLLLQRLKLCGTHYLRHTSSDLVAVSGLSMTSISKQAAGQSTQHLSEVMSSTCSVADTR